MHKIEIDPADLRRLYIEDHMSADQVAAHFGVSAAKIKKDLKKYGIQRAKADVSEEQLREMYIDQNLSSMEIATALGVSKNCIQRLRKKYNITKDIKEVAAARAHIIKETNLERYGCENPMQNEAVKQKFKQASIDRYGCEHPMQNDAVKEKLKDVFLEKYGCDNPMQNEEVRSKFRQTCIDRYGCETPFQNEEVRAKARKTNLEQYGCEYALQNDEVLSKMRSTNIDRYGCEYSSQNETVRQKAVQTNIEKYGCKNISQSHLSEDSLAVVSSEESLREFIQSHNILTTAQLCDALGYSMSHMRKILHGLELYDILDHHESSPEQEVRDYIDSLGVKNTRERSILNGKEIDIYCPDYKVGIEFNGIYWHSSLFKNRKYHYEKSRNAEDAGIRLIHIYENEWLDDRTQPIIKSLISLAFGKISCRIYARQCSVREITNEEARPFVDANHIQGHRNAKVTLGLFLEDELVQLMSFSHNKDYEWEIIRSCPLINTLVIGGVSKLFKHFIKLYDPSEVFSYADFNKFDGHGYESLGMDFIGYTGPDMKWIINGEVLNRNPSRNSELKELAEAQLFGAGSKKFLWKKGDRKES